MDSNRTFCDFVWHYDVGQSSVTLRRHNSAVVKKEIVYNNWDLAVLKTKSGRLINISFYSTCRTSHSYFTDANFRRIYVATVKNAVDERL